MCTDENKLCIYKGTVVAVIVYGSWIYNYQCLSPPMIWLRIPVMALLLVEETGENHKHVTSHRQTLSNNVVLSTPRHDRYSKSNHWWWQALIVVNLYIYLKTKIVVIAEFIWTWKPIGKCKKCLLRNCCTDENKLCIYKGTVVAVIVYGSWIYNYQCLSPPMIWLRIPIGFHVQINSAMTTILVFK
jgi:hypothetical protein